MIKISSDGDNLLYRLLSDLIKQGGSNGQWLVEHIVADCSVWWDPKVYAECPVLLPWAVRDPKSRGNKSKGLPDEWGSPNSAGYFRDDNSLVKGLVKALSVRGPAGGYMTGQRLGLGWVAAHIWRDNSGDVLASRDPRLYTFTPNLVWLPRQIAKLSDVEGGPVQAALKSISRALYRPTQPVGAKHAIAEKAWSYLADEQNPKHAIDLERLSYFDEPEKTIAMRQKRTKEVVDALISLESGGRLTKKVVSGRYTSGLPSVSAKARNALRWELEQHL
jgi:hypothetical protein